MSLDTFLQSNVPGLDYPTIRPALDLNFAKTKVLDPRITYSRNSIGTYVGSDGLIKTAVANEPRFDYDPVTGECLGFLMEESRTNFFNYSNSFDNLAWSQTNISIIPNAVISPEGIQNAYSIVSTSSGNSIVYRSLQQDSPSGFSIYLKSNTSNIAYLRILSNVVSRNVAYNINLLTGIMNPALGNTGNINGWTEYLNISNAGNGWYRIFLGFTSSSNNPICSYEISPCLNGNSNGNRESIYIWGSQQEKAIFPTSYIPTTTTSVTRVFDDATMTGKNFSSWFNQIEGTYIATATPTLPTYQQRLFNMSAGGTQEVTLFYSTNGYPSVYSDSGLGIGGIGLSTFSKKFVVAYKQLDFVISGNNQLVTSPIKLATTPTFDQAVFGRIGGGQYFNGTISRLAYYNKRLPNYQLQLLTK